MTDSPRTPLKLNSNRGTPISGEPQVPLTLTPGKLRKLFTPLLKTPRAESDPETPTASRPTPMPELHMTASQLPDSRPVPVLHAHPTQRLSRVDSTCSFPVLRPANQPTQLSGIQAVLDASGIGQIEIDTEGSVASSVALFEAPAKALALIKGQQKNPFSLVVAVVRKDTKGWVVSDLCHTGSTEKFLVLKGKWDPLERGQVLLLVNPTVISAATLEIYEQPQLLVIGSIEDLVECDKCQKPLRHLRDGKYCWAHSLSMQTEVRASIKGGILNTGGKSVSKGTGATARTAVSYGEEAKVVEGSGSKRPSAAENEKAAALARLEAKKRTAVWLQERNTVRSADLHAFGLSRIGGKGQSWEDDLEISDHPGKPVLGRRTDVEPEIERILKTTGDQNSPPDNQNQTTKRAKSSVATKSKKEAERTIELPLEMREKLLSVTSKFANAVRRDL